MIDQIKEALHRAKEFGLLVVIIVVELIVSLLVLWGGFYLTCAIIGYGLRIVMQFAGLN